MAFGMVILNVVRNIFDVFWSRFWIWQIHIRTEGYLDVFEKDNVVYLSSDSENVLEGKVNVYG